MRKKPPLCPYRVIFHRDCRRRESLLKPIIVVITWKPQLSFIKKNSPSNSCPRPKTIVQDLLPTGCGYPEINWEDGFHFWGYHSRTSSLYFPSLLPVSSVLFMIMILFYASSRSLSWSSCLPYYTKITISDAGCLFQSVLLFSCRNFQQQLLMKQYAAVNMPSRNKICFWRKTFKNTNSGHFFRKKTNFVFVLFWAFSSKKILYLLLERFLSKATFVRASVV